MSEAMAAARAEGTMKRQKTYHVTIKDRASGLACFESLRVYRGGKIVANPTPGICINDPLLDEIGDVEAAFGRIAERRLRLARLLVQRTFR